MSEVAKALTEAGLDAMRIGNRIQDQDVKDRLKTTTE
jgi:2-hydroxychromene-2-carboxylate isomerase